MVVGRGTVLCCAKRRSLPYELKAIGTEVRVPGCWNHKYLELFRVKTLHVLALQCVSSHIYFHRDSSVLGLRQDSDRMAGDR